MWDITFDKLIKPFVWSCRLLCAVRVNEHAVRQVGVASEVVSAAQEATSPPARTAGIKEDKRGNGFNASHASVRTRPVTDGFHGAGDAKWLKKSGSNEVLRQQMGRQKREQQGRSAGDRGRAKRSGNNKERASSGASAWQGRGRSERSVPSLGDADDVGGDLWQGSSAKDAAIWEGERAHRGRQPRRVDRTGDGWSGDGRQRGAQSASSDTSDSWFGAFDDEGNDTWLSASAWQDDSRGGHKSQGRGGRTGEESSFTNRDEEQNAHYVRTAWQRQADAGPSPPDNGGFDSPGLTGSHTDRRAGMDPKREPTRARESRARGGQGASGGFGRQRPSSSGAFGWSDAGSGAADAANNEWDVAGQSLAFGSGEGAHAAKQQRRQRKGSESALAGHGKVPREANRDRGGGRTDSRPTQNKWWSDADVASDAAWGSWGPLDQTDRAGSSRTTCIAAAACLRPREGDHVNLASFSTSEQCQCLHSRTPCGSPIQRSQRAAVRCPFRCGAWSMLV
jgi:hypothetical protein